MVESAQFGLCMALLRSVGLGLIYDLFWAGSCWKLGAAWEEGSSAREKPKSHYGRTRFLRFLLRRCVAGKQWFMQIVSEIKSFSWLKYSYGGTLCFFFCMKSWLAEDRVDRRVRVRRK